MKILILDGYTANPGDLSWDGFRKIGDIEIYDRTSQQELFNRNSDADAILTNKVVMGKAQIDHFPNLKYIGVLATGYNVVDLEYSRERGITVTNIPAYSTESVAQMVFAHILAITNRVEHYANDNRTNQRWSSSADFSYFDTPIHELSGKTMGIIGFGNIGSSVARIAAAFGMKVLVWSSKKAEDLPQHVAKASFSELLHESHILTLHCPLTNDTHHLINDATLKEMRQGAILINTGRGPLVDEEAVAAALNSGKLSAYGADVMTVEPPTPDSALLSHPHAFITPHIAWASVEARQRLIDIALSNLLAFINGKPVNVVSK